MPNPNFDTIPLYPYRSGLFDLVQYSLIQEADLSLLPNNENERLTRSVVNGSAYQFTFQDKTFIKSSDFQDKSMLAKHVGRSLTKTAAAFVTQYRPPLDPPTHVVDPYLNISVGKFDETGVLINYIVASFVATVRDALGMSFYCITSSTNEVRG